MATNNSSGRILRNRPNSSPQSGNGNGGGGGGGGGGGYHHDGNDSMFSSLQSMLMVTVATPPAHAAAAAAAAAAGASSNGRADASKHRRRRRKPSRLSCWHGINSRNSMYYKAQVAVTVLLLAGGTLLLTLSVRLGRSMMHYNGKEDRVRGRRHRSHTNSASTPQQLPHAAAVRPTDQLPLAALRVREGEAAFTAEQQQQYAQFHMSNAQAPSCQDVLTPDDLDYTLVTQLSHDRVWMLQHHCERWPGYLSIAVYTHEARGALQARLMELGCHEARTILQTVAPPTSAGSLADYPVNALRNLALSLVPTSHLVYLDVDFWPSTELYTVLMQEPLRQAFVDNALLAVVVPAFQLGSACGPNEECHDSNVPRMPHTQLDLLRLIKKKRTDQFDPYNAAGHGSTNYRGWLTQAPDELLPITCVRSNRYEPYLVTRYCADLPPFCTAFTGYGKNKMTWVMLLLRLGYQLAQLGRAYCVHYPHIESAARTAWNNNKELDGRPGRKPKSNFTTTKRGQVDALFVQYRDWLQMLPDRPRVLRCTDGTAVDDDARLWIERSTNGQA